MKQRKKQRKREAKVMMIGLNRQPLLSFVVTQSSMTGAPVLISCQSNISLILDTRGDNESYLLFSCKNKLLWILVVKEEEGADLCLIPLPLLSFKGSSSCIFFSGRVTGFFLVSLSHPGIFSCTSFLPTQHMLLLPLLSTPLDTQESRREILRTRREE